jgi:uncharacterized delta-60 repeat protein
MVTLALLIGGLPGETKAVKARWTKTFNGAWNTDDSAWGVAVCPDGNIVVVGTIYKDNTEIRNIWLSKYTPSGKKVWTTRYNGPDSGSDYGRGVAVAPNGSIYVAGASSRAGSGTDIILQKYSTGGKLKWTRWRTSAGSFWDDAYGGVAVAPNGEVYVAGVMDNGSEGGNAWLGKFSPKGKERWTRMYDGAGEQDIAYGLAVSNDGKVYIAGFSSQPVTFNRNLFLRKYSPKGVDKWTEIYNGSAMDEGMAVAVAPNGQIYVAGSTGGTGFDRAVLLRKYSSTGKFKWMKTHDPGTSTDQAWGVAVDPDGGVYVNGLTSVSAFQGNIWTRKYTPRGGKVWTRKYDGGSGDKGYGITTASDGSVYAVGYTSVSGEGYNGWIRKYR